jgi:hypothetical protein
MAEHIQIGDISPRIQYTADGSQTVFTYPFPIFADSDLEVFLDDAEQASGFSVAGAGASEGGTVTFDTAPATDTVVTLLRNVPIERTSDFQESGEFRAKVINDELDREIAMIQQVDDKVARSLRLSQTDSADNLELPEKAARAGALLGFDANGDPVASAGSSGGVAVSTFMEGLLDDTTAAAARATLGALGGDTSATLGAGFLTASHDLGSLTTDLTPSVADGQIQHGTLAADITINLPSDTDQGYLEIELLNSGSRSLTVAAGYTQVGGAFDGTDGARNAIRISMLNSKTVFETVALGS